MRAFDKLKHSGPGHQIRRGAGTILSFCISVTCVLFIMLYALSIVQANIGMNELETAGEIVVRDLIVCESLDEAQDMADKEVSELLGKYQTLRGVTASVYTMSGSETEWKKGDYVVLTIDAEVNALLMPARAESVRSVMMIERNG